MALKFKLFWLL